MEIKLFTIGFTQKPAREFFTSLKEAGVKRVVDVRLNNNSQLAGFSKKEDLAYFLKEIGGIDYVHVPDLAQRAVVAQLRGDGVTVRGLPGDQAQHQPFGQR